MKELFEVINKLALAEIEKFGGPSLNHYNLSLIKCEEIAKRVGVGVDINLVKCGIALMDIKLGECIKNGKQKEHVKESLKYAKQILEENNVDIKIKELLLNCVEAHHGAVPYKSLEAEVCANADCYRFIHPQGVFTFMQTVTKRGLSQDETINAVLDKLEEKHNIVSLPCVKQELEPLYQQIKQLLLMAKIN